MPYARGITNALSVDLGSRTIYSKTGSTRKGVSSVNWSDKNFTQSLEYSTVLGYGFSVQRSANPFGKGDTWSTSTTFYGFGVEFNNNGIAIGFMGSGKLAAGLGAEFSVRDTYNFDLW